MEAINTKAYRSHVEAFGDGSKVTLISPDLRVALLTKGATLHSVQYRPPPASAAAAAADEEAWVELTLGYDTPEEFEKDTSYMGRTCGRFAGRIENGEFVLDGQMYKLLQNDGKHTLHGGPDGFSKRQWKYLLLEGEEEIGISFHLSSPHLDQGFPGEVFVTATYSIVKNKPATLKWNLQAVLSDSSPVDSTTINLCNHVYWNLNGVPSGSSSSPTPVPRHLPDIVLNHHLQLHSHYVAETIALIPTGLMNDVDGTPHDYRRSRPLLEGVLQTEKEGRDPPGYDDPVALETWDSKLREAAVLYSPKTHITMIVETTSPAVVVYTANFFPKEAGGGVGERFQQHSGICLETQYFPNSPNIPSFPSTLIRKHNKYDETTTCHFRILPQK